MRNVCTASGTTITFHPDPQIFGDTVHFSPARLYRMARSGGRYTRTLELLDRSRQHKPEIATKTGIMVGLGEEHDEILTVFDDLRRVGATARALLVAAAAARGAVASRVRAVAHRRRCRQRVPRPAVAA